MNAEATNGLRIILLKLKDDIFQLASTVTKGLLKNVQMETQDEAIEAIMRYSADAESILRRKIVTTDILFSYLYECGVAVPLPATKNTLIRNIIRKWDVDSQREKSLMSSELIRVGELACKFSEWYYTLMNGNEPIGVEHFWEDAALKLNVFAENTLINCHEIAQQSDEIVHTLFRTKMSHNLTFNPNLLNNGAQGQLNHHGLVRVLCCGTLHSNNNCVGLFEQVFMLARDPNSENNWKIKSTELNLRSQSALTEAPSPKNRANSSNYLQLST